MTAFDDALRLTIERAAKSMSMWYLPGEAQQGERRAIKCLLRQPRDKCSNSAWAGELCRELGHDRAQLHAEVREERKAETELASAQDEKEASPAESPCAKDAFDERAQDTLTESKAGSAHSAWWASAYKHVHRLAPQGLTWLAFKAGALHQTAKSNEAHSGLVKDALERAHAIYERADTNRRERMAEALGCPSAAPWSALRNVAEKLTERPATYSKLTKCTVVECSVRALHSSMQMYEYRLAEIRRLEALGWTIDRVEAQSAKLAHVYAFRYEEIK